jgi:hypothetical protein
VVAVYMRYLRAKVDRPFGVETIETVRGVGYRLRADRVDDGHRVEEPAEAARP